jgi:hypothetical protein
MVTDTLYDATIAVHMDRVAEHMMMLLENGICVAKSVSVGE